MTTTDEHGYEEHPAWGVIGASRGQTTGTTLFDSDIVHRSTIRIRIKAATRKRDLKHDWIGGRDQLIEVELSEAQWASFVSTMNVSDGVPCTVRRIGHQPPIENPPHEPRLAVSMDETRTAAEEAYRGIQTALDAYEAALAGKAGAAERRKLLSTLHYAVANAVPNVAYAGTQLTEHAENVVQRARADIEAFVVGKAGQLGLEPGDIASPLELEA